MAPSVMSHPRTATYAFAALVLLVASVAWLLWSRPAEEAPDAVGVTADVQSPATVTHEARRDDLRARPAARALPVFVPAAKAKSAPLRTLGFEGARIEATHVWRQAIDGQLMECLPRPKHEQPPASAVFRLRHSAELSSDSLQRFVVEDVRVASESPPSPGVSRCLHRLEGTTVDVLIGNDAMPRGAEELEEVFLLPL